MARRRGPTTASRLAVVGGVLAVLFLATPLVAIAAKADWGSLGADLTSPTALTALRVSLVCSLWATVIAIALGAPLAWLLARSTFPGRRVVRAIALVPLVLPPVVGGVALLLAFGRRGLFGSLVDTWFGVTLPFTTAGAAIAEAFVAMPFFVITAEAAFRGVDQRLEAAARTLGASRWMVFRRVTLPLAAPSLAAGAVLAWARALGEFGATITFAGNSPGRTTTVPLQVYVLLESGDLDAAIALSIVLLAVSVALLVALRDRWWGAI